MVSFVLREKLSVRFSGLCCGLFWSGKDFLVFLLWVFAVNLWFSLIQAP